MNKHKKTKGDYTFTDEQIFQTEEERLRVLGLNELKREQYITQRVEQLKLEMDRAELLKKRPGDLDKLKKKEHDKSREMQDESDSESGEISKHEDDNWSGDSRKSNRRRASSSSESSASSLTNSEEKEGKNNGSLNLSALDIEKVKVARQFFEKYYEIPLFDTQIKGTFVKINISSGKSTNAQETGYVLGKIKDIIINKDKPYKFLGKDCEKYINVTHANKDKAFPYYHISNSPITDSEFNSWRQNMEKLSLPLPTGDELKSLTENIFKIKDYKYTNEELSKMINQKMEQKIKNHDKNINITYELDLLNEKYNSAKIKYEETNDEKYLEIAEKVLPELQSLRKMKEERELKETQRAEKDLVTQINKRNVEKQRQEDIKSSLIHKKREREVNDVFNPYKRKDCKPMNLFDSGYMKEKKAEEANKETAENNNSPKEEDVINQSSNTEELKRPEHLTVYQQMKKIEKKIKSFSGELQEAVNSKTADINPNNTKMDMKLFFSLASINKEHYDHLIQTQNKRLTEAKGATIINLSKV